MNIIEKTWNKNKIYLHSLPAYSGKEIHHCQKRRKNCIERCCLALMVPGDKGHENNYKWVNEQREKTREDFKAAKENYLKNMGCKKMIFAGICVKCAMQKVGAK